MLHRAWYQSRRGLEGTEFTVTLQAYVVPLTKVERDAHWTGRLGELLPQSVDTWWKLSEDNLDSVAVEQSRYFIEVIVPALNHYGRSKYLINEWRNERYTYISEPQRLRLLARAVELGY